MWPGSVSERPAEWCGVVVFQRGRRSGVAW